MDKPIEDGVSNPPARGGAASDGSWKVLLLVPVMLVLLATIFYFVLRSPKGSEDTLRRDVSRDFLNPASAEFRNIRWLTGSSVCGEVNGENAFGGKSGFRRFYATEKVDGGGYSVIFEGMTTVEDAVLNNACSEPPRASQ